jgi:hypothetical protein
MTASGARIRTPAAAGEADPPAREPLARLSRRHPWLPVVPQLAVTFTERERDDAARLAQQLLRDEPGLRTTAPFGPQVTAGLGPWPGLFIEDHSAIALFETRGDESYSYRALLLAGEGGLAVIGVKRSPGFEAYCRDRLRLGRVEILTPRPGPQALALRCTEDQTLIERAAAHAKESGGLNLVPYMGTGGVWKLAGKIAEASGTEVRVAAPPPRLVRRVNDKLWFAARVSELIGPRALPPAHPCFGLASLTGRIAALARRHAAVAVKLPASASSAGNIVLEAGEVWDLSLRGLRDRLHRLLLRVGWSGQFPLMVTAWESPIFASPSVQIWIPEKQCPEILVEGIFDQQVIGATRSFAGAAPTSLSMQWRQRLAREASRLGLLFQALGYFGRCSFDAILVGERETGADLHWVECNGRWGGTSIPMTLANRLVGSWHRHPFVIVERDDLALPGQDAALFLEGIADQLFLPGQRECGAVLLSPGQVERGTGFEMMVLDETLEGARRRAEALERRLAGGKTRAE